MPDAFDDLQRAIDAAEQAAAAGNLAHGGGASARGAAPADSLRRRARPRRGSDDPQARHRLRAHRPHRRGRGDVPPGRRGGLSGAAGRRPAAAAVQRRPDRLPGGGFRLRGGGRAPAAGAAAGASQRVAGRSDTGSRAGARRDPARRIRPAGAVRNRDMPTWLLAALGILAALAVVALIWRSTATTAAPDSSSRRNDGRRRGQRRHRRRAAEPATPAPCGPSARTVRVRRQPGPDSAARRPDAAAAAAPVDAGTGSVTGARPIRRGPLRRRPPRPASGGARRPAVPSAHAVGRMDLCPTRESASLRPLLLPDPTGGAGDAPGRASLVSRRSAGAVGAADHPRRPAGPGFAPTAARRCPRRSRASGASNCARRRARCWPRSASRCDDPAVVSRYR